LQKILFDEVELYYEYLKVFFITKRPKPTLANRHAKNSFLQKYAEISGLALWKPCSLDAKKV
jgi:hypothetical protein